ncbi:Exo 5'-3' exonuclease (including N-terminal domain of PolI) [uncultured Caudovirales phage]|uniref:Exo 5'-3' exonuclease (Including N-terminal domain of PolI) n=1 Tax=uncultured Caudovirales phage TaxID=2100421 RepID=A0A6J5RT79_9CAUD|nr:Exo 5'-3' exonuclease (including N-terminal domain of PolI) [uncultured Caudovirales phage]
MDRILLIDGLNSVYRAMSTFGHPTKHERCVQCDVDKHIDVAHCICSSPWDEENSLCYGDQYLIVYNFFRNLRPQIEEFSPDKCFFVLEGHPQFRYDLFSDYKANRIIKTASKQDSRDKFSKARDIIVDLLQYLPITTARASLFEADDTIATLCENMKEEDLSIISSDSDYIQLLQKGYKNIRVFNPIKKEDMVAPSYPYVAWKCLNGDKSDNIPALLKPAKALKTISDSILFKNFMEVEENRSNFNINRQLIEFRPVSESDIILKDGIGNFEILREKFNEMKFVSITNEKSWSKYKNTFNCLKF